MMKNLSSDLLFHLIPFLTNKSFYALGTTNKAFAKIWPWGQRLMIPPPWTYILCQGYMNTEPNQENFAIMGNHFNIFRGRGPAGRNIIYYDKGREEDIKVAWFDQFGEECPALHYECDFGGFLKVPFDFRPLNIKNYMRGNKDITIYCRNGEPLSEIIKWLWPLIVQARIHNF